MTIGARMRSWLQRRPEAEPELRVLMVCMGNICRSPTAEGVLRHKLREAGLDGRVAVDSAGTHGYHTGEPPDPRAVRHAAARGYDIAGLRARPVDAADFERHDWWLAMDAANLAWLRKRSPPGLSDRAALLLSFAGGAAAGADVPDPYYGAPAGFDTVLDLVEQGCDGFVATLRRSLHRP